MGLGSGIRKKPIPDPGSSGQKGTGSRILNPESGSATLHGAQINFGDPPPYLIYAFVR
jgi:hypothetical protein